MCEREREGGRERAWERKRERRERERERERERGERGRERSQRNSGITKIMVWYKMITTFEIILFFFTLLRTMPASACWPSWRVDRTRRWLNELFSRSRQSSW